MKEKISPPKPFFDKLDKIDKIPYNCIQEYLCVLNLKNIDIEYNIIRNYLAAYAGSNDTYTAYRREIEKLIQWSWTIKKTLVKNVTRNDIIEFLDFVQNPPNSWIATKIVKRFKESKSGDISFNKEWRPFVVKIPKYQYKEGKIPYKHNFTLSGKSIQSTFATLSSFFTYLVQEQYIQTNPVALIRQKSKYIQREQNMKVTRKLSDLQWKSVIKSTQDLASQDPNYLRTYFILSCFYLLGLRISELAETPGRIPCMGDFYPDHNSLWWFSTVGKGNKLREVAVPSQLLEILKKYRISRSLIPLPSRGEKTPLIHKNKGRNGLGTRQIRNIVQDSFNIAIEKLKKQQLLDDALDLENATVHWLRHTAISNDVKHRPREHIRDDVGHSNPATMDKYIDIDRRERHESAQEKKLLS